MTDLIKAAERIRGVAMNPHAWDEWYPVHPGDDAGVLTQRRAHTSDVRLVAEWVQWFVKSSPDETHPSHRFTQTALSQCVLCGGWPRSKAGKLPCDPSTLAGKTEPCCECGNDYPVSDLIAGEIYCPKCRTEPWAQAARK